MSTHAQSMPNEMCVAASAPLQTSSEFVEAVAQLLQKRRVRVARHLTVRVEAHQMQLRDGMQKSGMRGMQSMACHNPQWNNQSSKTG